VSEVVAKQKEYIPEMDERGFMRHLDDLKKGYRKTLSRLQARRKEIANDVGNETSGELWRAIDNENEVELDLIKGMISDVNYAIEWLHTGRQPNAKRGIDRRSVYQRTVYMDPAKMQHYMRPTNSRSASTLTEDERDRLRDVLSILSERERECYELHYGYGFTYDEVAVMLKISKGSVEEYVKRAHAKVSAGWQGTLF
jgi:RNA polymerase sigma-70 factor (ECF subfamily)